MNANEKWAQGASSFIAYETGGGTVMQNKRQIH